MAKRRVTVEQWLNEALADEDKDGPCTTISLMYVKPGGNLEEIHSKVLKQGQTYSTKQLGDFFMNKSCAYAQDLPGIQTFKMLAFYNGREQPQASFPFTIVDGEMTGGGETAFARHEPSEKGLLAQLMKHNEQMSGILVQITQSTLVQSAVREQGLRAEVAEAQTIVRDVIMNMTKEHQAHELAKLQYIRETEERRMLGKALPAAINHLTGREVIPQGHADSEILDAMAEKVKPEHLTLLVGMKILTQEQATLLAARFTKTLEERQKEQALLKDIPGEDKKPAGEAQLPSGEKAAE
jgi:hypothetical protein